MIRTEGFSIFNVLFRGLIFLTQPIEPLIGHRDDSRIGFNGTKGKIFSWNIELGETIEKGRFTHV